MGLTEAVRTVYSKYVTFDGRARRSEFWFFTLFVTLVNIGSTILTVAFGLIGLHGLVKVLDVLVVIFGLGTLLPNLAVSVRRLHDGNRSGWFVLLGLIPIVGMIILLVWYCKRGTVGPNRFGPDPLETGA